MDTNNVHIKLKTSLIALNKLSLPAVDLVGMQQILFLPPGHFPVSILKLFRLQEFLFLQLPPDPIHFGIQQMLSTPPGHFPVLTMETPGVQVRRFLHIPPAFEHLSSPAH